MPSESEGRQEELWAGTPPEPTPVVGVSPGKEKEEGREPGLKPINRHQLLLRTVDVDRLVEPDHPVRAIWELVGRLDLSPFRADIGSVEGTAGRPAFGSSGNLCVNRRPLGERMKTPTVLHGLRNVH
jgi:hypothetical protein